MVETSPLLVFQILYAMNTFLAKRNAHQTSDHSRNVLLDMCVYYVLPKFVRIGVASQKSVSMQFRSSTQSLRKHHHIPV